MIFDSILGKKMDISTFCSFKNVNNADKPNVMKNIFISGKSFAFPKKSDAQGERSFQHSWFELSPWLLLSHCRWNIFYILRYI